MYEKGVLKFRYRKEKLVKRYQSGKGEEGEERKYEEISTGGKKEKQGENKNGDKANQRIFGDDNDENEKALHLLMKINGDSIQIR